MCAKYSGDGRLGDSVVQAAKLEKQTDGIKFGHISLADFGS